MMIFIKEIQELYPKLKKKKNLCKTVTKKVKIIFIFINQVQFLKVTKMKTQKVIP